jgi:hypothetical protein
MICIRFRRLRKVRKQVIITPTAGVDVLLAFQSSGRHIPSYRFPDNPSPPRPQLAVCVERAVSALFQFHGCRLSALGVRTRTAAKPARQYRCWWLADGCCFPQLSGAGLCLCAVFSASPGRRIMRVDGCGRRKQPQSQRGFPFTGGWHTSSAGYQRGHVIPLAPAIARPPT